MGKMARTNSVCKILADGLAFPEGPAFAPDASVWMVEMKGGNLCRWADGRLSRVAVGGLPNGIAFDARGRVVFCDAGHCAIRQYDPESDQSVTLADAVDGEPLCKPNDLAFDPAGNLVFTCPGDSRTEPTGYIAGLKADGSVRLVASGFYFPNGLAFAPDGLNLIVAETRRQRLWRGKWDAANARWLAPRPWARVGGTIGPDGMAFAEDGRLFVAIYSGGAVKVVAPDGEFDQVTPSARRQSY